MQEEGKKYDLAILVHKCEGRLFLTDENGYYNDLLVELDRITMGYTLIILTCNKGKLLESTNGLMTEDISILATKGAQPKLLEYGNRNQIQVWNKKGP